MSLRETGEIEYEGTAEERRAAAQRLESIVSELSAPSSEAPAATAPFSAVALLPIMAVVFIAYLVIGIALPVLPLHVHQGLGLGTFVVGLVAGSQFAAALVTRPWAGQLVDSRGAKQGIVIGLFFAAASGLFYLFSLRFVGTPETSVTILLMGRGLLGAAESFIITGALSWGLSLLGTENTGKVMSWVGTALYAALAVGAPAGTALYSGYGLAAIALATTLIPLGTLLLMLPLRAVPAPSRRTRVAFRSVAAAVWLPGLGVAISGVGFGAITTFVVLLFEEHGWGPAWLAFTLLSVAFIAGRLVFGHLPDKIGGARVALVCVLIEAVGLVLIWLSHSSTLALAGVTLTGLGYSLVYPGFGVEAIRRAPRESRGLAMGAYTAFLDLSLGVTGPALGLVAGMAGLSSVFIVSTLVVLSASAIALRLISEPSVPDTAIGPGSLENGQNGVRAGKYLSPGLRPSEEVR